MTISGSVDLINLIALIWVSLEISFPPAELEHTRLCEFLVKGDDVGRGTKANACHGFLPTAQVSVV